MPWGYDFNFLVFFPPSIIWIESFIFFYLHSQKEIQHFFLTYNFPFFFFISYGGIESFYLWMVIQIPIYHFFFILLEFISHVQQPIIKENNFFHLWNCKLLHSQGKQSFKYALWNHIISQVLISQAISWSTRFSQFLENFCKPRIFLFK